MHLPNGSVITPDGRTLIVAETFGRRLTAFDLDANGNLSNRRVWAQTGSRRPDGICLNANGAIWIANPAAPECVLIAEGGDVLDVVETEHPCFACMLGGDDGRTLFMLTAPTTNGILASANHHAISSRAHVIVAPTNYEGGGRCLVWCSNRGGCGGGLRRTRSSHPWPLASRHPSHETVRCIRHPSLAPLAHRAEAQRASRAQTLSNCLTRATNNDH